jgi:hypothetical protein
MKFKDLEINEVYEDVNGYFRFTGMRNSNIAEFEEITYDENDNIIVLDDCIYKTEHDICRW